MRVRTHDRVQGAGQFTEFFLVTLHEGYAHKNDVPKPDWDIAVLRWPDNFTPGDNAKSVMNRIDAAEIYDESMYVGMRLDLYGWGTNSLGGGNGGVLRKGRDNSELRVDQFDSHSFTGTSDKARACRGDSGGPALRWLDNFEAVTAIFSQSQMGDDDCTLKGQKQMYTRLAHKIDWIERSTGATCNQVCLSKGCVRVCR
jgi:hypothetical protein